MSEPTWDNIDTDTRSLLDLLPTDDYTDFLAQLAKVAGANNGVIDLNLLRPHIAHIDPHLRGNYIGKAQREGVIVQHGYNKNGDVGSRNRGKPQPLYLLSGAA